MAKDKKSFILYSDYKELFEELPNEDAGELIKHIFRYVNDENPEPKNNLIKVAFIPIKLQLKRDLKKWDSTIESKSNAGKISAANKAFNKFKYKISQNIKSIDLDFEINYCKKHIKDYKLGDYMIIYYNMCIDYLEEQKQTKSTRVESVEQKQTKSTVNVNVNDNVTVNVNDNVTVNEIKNNYKTTLLSDLKKSDFDNSEYFEITISFYELFKHNLSNSGISTSRIEKSKGVWIDSIRLLIENDKFTKEDLREVFEFLKTNDFWKKNILSTSTLREKFERLLFESRSNNKNKYSKDQEWNDYKRKVLNDINNA